MYDAAHEELSQHDDGLPVIVLGIVLLVPEIKDNCWHSMSLGMCSTAFEHCSLLNLRASCMHYCAKRTK
jgi:hypothetical protein